MMKFFGLIAVVAGQTCPDAEAGMMTTLASAETACAGLSTGDLTAVLPHASTWAAAMGAAGATDTEKAQATGVFFAATKDKLTCANTKCIMGFLDAAPCTALNYFRTTSNFASVCTAMDTMWALPAASGGGGAACAGDNALTCTWTPAAADDDDDTDETAADTAASTLMAAWALIAPLMFQ
jgi:hypothetical protein